jgi:uncharacterized membrane protein
VSATEIELLDLVARWVHVIAGIMWIGNSLLFNWLDRNLVSAGDKPQTPRPLGIIWLLHSGGFYYVEKTLLDGAPMPPRLHWFKWQAYTTWWSGTALLFVVYYLGGRALLADSSVRALTHTQAVLVGGGGILLGLVLYETMQRVVAPRAPRWAGAIWLSGLLGITIGFTQLLNGRAAFLHVGAMLGTIMAANVVLTIVPSQRALVASAQSGGGGGESARLSARAKRVSIHNNYFTFPVIALMLSGHFPSLYGQPDNWMPLLVLIAGGAAVRHVLNVRFAFRAWRSALFGAIAATVVALYFGLRMGSRDAPIAVANASGPVSLAEVRHVVDRRCGACHSVRQSDGSFGPAPGGVTFDTPAEILARAARIRERAVVTRTMPPGNKTRITDEERGLLGRWVAQLPR